MSLRKALVVSALMCFGLASLYPKQAIAQSNGPTSFEATLDGSETIQFNGRYLDGYEVFGNEGDRVAIRMSSRDFVSYIGLSNSQKRPIAGTDDAVRGNGNAELIVTFPYTGTYYIYATSRVPGAKGRYRMSLSQIPTEAEERAINAVTRAFLGIITADDGSDSTNRNQPNSLGCINGVIVLDGITHVC